MSRPWRHSRRWTVVRGTWGSLLIGTPSTDAIGRGIWGWHLVLTTRDEQWGPVDCRAEVGRVHKWLTFQAHIHLPTYCGERVWGSCLALQPLS